MTSWHDVAVKEVSSSEGLELPVGHAVDVTARIQLGSLSPDDVTVEAYYGRLDHRGEFVERETVILEPVGASDGLYTFKGSVPCSKTGRFGCTVRVMPSHKKLENRFVMGLVSWA